MLPSLTPSTPAISSPIAIKFGTDGWRGVIAREFTFERLEQVAPVAAEVLAQTYGTAGTTRRIIVGYDRRFLSEEFAQATARAVSLAGFEVLLADTFAPTPAFSWIVKQTQALGALVITASHNPGIYSGLKIKGAFGGSVPPEITAQVETRLAMNQAPVAVETPGQIQTFNPWPDYCQVLGSKVQLPLIQQAIAEGRLEVFVDVMYGATAGGLAQILGCPIQELHSQRDPLFGGGAPEPLPRYLGELCQILRSRHQGTPTAPIRVGFVFDGDGDRIAAVDGAGNFLSSQILIPILIQHLAVCRGLQGEVIKTLSGSDLMPRVAALYRLPVYETAIGYKYIADRMLTTDNVLLGGEESGGIGYGNHIPERDGLLSALYLLEAIAESGQGLSQLYQQLQAQTNFSSAYDRIDLPLASMESRAQLLEQLQTQPPQEIIGLPVIDCQSIDGYKFRLADQSWLLIRFSGTEPILRLYSEAPTLKQVHQILNWAKDWAT